MALLMPNGGEAISLSYLVGKSTTVRDLVYRLMTNDLTLSETMTAASFTEAAGADYAAKTLVGASWTVSAGTASHPQIIWTFSGSLTTNLTVYGYYVTRVSDADLVLAEKFTAFTPANVGDQILLTPQITAD